MAGSTGVYPVAEIPEGRFVLTQIEYPCAQSHRPRRAAIRASRGL